MAWDSPYLTAAELRTRITKRSVAGDESLLTPICLAASRLVEEAAERRFNQTAVGTIRYFAGSGHGQIVVDDLVSVSALSVDEDASGDYSTLLGATEYRLLPRNAAEYGKPFTHIALTSSASSITYWRDLDDWVKVTGVFGWPAVPALAKEWTALVARQMLDLHEAGSTMTLEGIGNEVRVTPGYMALTKDIRRHMSRWRLSF